MLGGQTQIPDTGASEQYGMMDLNLSCPSPLPPTPVSYCTASCNDGDTVETPWSVNNDFLFAIGKLWSSTKFYLMTPHQGNEAGKAVYFRWQIDFKILFKNRCLLFFEIQLIITFVLKILHDEHEVTFLMHQ